MKTYSATEENIDLSQIKRFSEESAGWQIPLQCTYTVRHFAKATNTVRDGCIQATGRQASAAHT